MRRPSPRRGSPPRAARFTFALALASGCGPAAMTSEPPPASVDSVCPDVPDGLSECFGKTGITIGATSWKIKTGPMNGAALGDCDGDGLPDAFVFNWLGDGRLYRNRGGFRFEDVTAADAAVTVTTEAAGAAVVTEKVRPLE